MVAGYETKDAKSFRDELQKRLAPELSCPECPNEDILVGEKSADGAKVQRWFRVPRLRLRKAARQPSTAPSAEIIPRVQRTPSTD